MVGFGIELLAETKIKSQGHIGWASTVQGVILRAWGWEDARGPGRLPKGLSLSTDAQTVFMVHCVCGSCLFHCSHFHPLHASTHYTVQGKKTLEMLNCSNIAYCLCHRMDMYLQCLFMTMWLFIFLFFTYLGFRIFFPRVLHRCDYNKADSAER